MNHRSTECLEDVATRHGCVASVANNSALPCISPYETLVISSEDGLVVPSLTQAIHAVRQGYEIVDVYVRARDERSVRPLQIAATSLTDAVSEVPVVGQREGVWHLVIRKRHPTHGPRIVGIMLAKDEQDVIGEVVTKLTHALERLYFHAVDAPTREGILAVAPGADWAVAVDVFEGIRADGRRQSLLERVRADGEGDPRPTWVMVVQGDEIYRDDLRHHVHLADEERATVLNCHVSTFLLHEGQRHGWDWSRPLVERFTHYIWDFGEHVGFLDFPWLHYEPSEHMRAHPRSIYPGVWATKWPVRYHYPFRNPDQARARLEDRLKSGWQPHYENYRDVFMGDVAAGRQMKPFTGRFSEIGEF